MDAVLGLSMTPTTVGLVLVGGQDADGATMDRDEFAVHDRSLVSAVNTSEKAAAAVTRTEAIAAARGHRLNSIGVTWSEDADTEASLLLESLSESGFDNVVAVRLPEATEALARGIAGVIGYEIAAVCVIEPDAIIVLVVDTTDDTVQTAVTHAVSTDEDLARWLSAIFAQAEWRPEALVLVGSCDLEAITPHLEDVLAVPVLVPAEAQLALARGAAIASTQGPDIFVDESGDDCGRVHTTSRRASLFPRVGAAGAMLGVGVVTLVVSGSLAIGLQLTSGESAKRTEKPTAASTSAKPAAVQAVQPAPAAPPSTIEAALPPPPQELPPPPVYDTEPVPISEPLVPDAVAPDAVAPDPMAPVDESVPVTPLPEQQPDDPAQAPVDAVPPPQDPLLVPPPADAPPPPSPG